VVNCLSIWPVLIKKEELVMLLVPHDHYIFYILNLVCGLFVECCFGLMLLVRVGALSELGSSLGALRRS
jgi:hypothetical protein